MQFVERSAVASLLHKVKPSHTAKAIERLACSVELLAYVQLKGIEQSMADFTRLTAAVQAVSAGVTELLDAIRNPAADGDQADIDAAAENLEAVIRELAEGLALEQAEDGTAAPEAPAE
jgi:hypothetical protein